MDWLWIALAAFIVYHVVAPRLERRAVWRGNTPHVIPLIYLEPRMAVRPTVVGHHLPEAYRLSCLYFGAGLLDRTQTLDHGFPYKILDPIPEETGATADIAALCDARAHRLVELSRSTNKPIRVLWSGGIDSTAACVALLKALDDEPERLEIAYSFRSTFEYRDFYKRFVKPHPGKRRFGSISKVLGNDAILTSGEHGDQLFGSIKALTIPFDTLNEPWDSAFPNVLNAKFASPGRTDAVIAYLEPQISQCPIAVHTLYDLLWWMNFSLKWQAVSLRMLSPLQAAGFRATERHLHHFFQTPEFQCWSLANPDKRIKNDWKSYKWPLKAYIREFTNDGQYFDEKEKEPSLRGMLSRSKKRLALAVDDRRQPLYELRDVTLRDKNHSDRGFEREYSYEREFELWEDMGGGE